MALKLDISDIASHSLAAEALIKFAGVNRIFAFNAPMGAGKTTFIKSLCRCLEVKDTMSSPTYAIVNEYTTATGATIYHFDLYRLHSSHELLDIGFEEYLSRQAYVFIEWPELALPFLNNYVKVSIGADKNTRYLYADLCPHG